MSTPEASPRLLLVDDDPQALESTRKILELAGYGVVTASDGQAALDVVRGGGRFDAVVTDVRMPRMGGLEFLRALSLCGRRMPVILMTAFGRVEDAVWAMKLGAVDFLTKPFKRQALLQSVSAAIRRAPAEEPAEAGELLGGSEAMRRLRAELQRVAPTAATVLLTGESGTGKELAARRIHAESPRARGAFIALNCAAVPETLIESELFGHERGAFTGATAAKAGLFEAADGGTLLLDEIGDMPLALQSKLLRVIQEGEVRRLGATASRKVDVRVLAATHRDLREEARTGSFRQDLLFRLEVIAIHVPPLRERHEDVPELARRFLAQAALRHGKALDGIAPDALDRLMAHPWPGNVRELSNVIERAVVFAAGPLIRSEDLPAHVGGGRPVAATISVRVGTPLREVEDLLIRKTLEATAGDKNMTAKLLGINSRTIYRKLEPKEPA
jgi:two-component system response regulator HydG